MSRSLIALRSLILGMTNPIAQRYAFAKYVLGEDRMTACAIAGRFQDELMDEREFDIVAAGWGDSQ